MLLQLLAGLPLGAQTRVEYRATLSLTNLTGITNGAFVTVASSTRTWTNNPTVDPAAWVGTTNTIQNHTTNLLRNLQRFAPSGPVFTVTNGATTTSMVCFAYETYFAVTPSGGWLGVTYATNYYTNSYPLNLPFTSEPLARRTNAMSEVVTGLNTYPSNKLLVTSAVMDNFGGLGESNTWTGTNWFESIVISGSMNIGGTSMPPIFGAGRINILGASVAQLNMKAIGNSAGNEAQVLLHRARGSEGAETNAVNGDDLGSIEIFGKNNGSGYSTALLIEVLANEDFTNATANSSLVNFKTAKPNNLAGHITWLTVQEGTNIVSTNLDVRTSIKTTSLNVSNVVATNVTIGGTGAGLKATNAELAVANQTVTNQNVLAGTLTNVAIAASGLTATNLQAHGGNVTNLSGAFNNAAVTNLQAYGGALSNMLSIHQSSLSNNTYRGSNDWNGDVAWTFYSMTSLANGNNVAVAFTNRNVRLAGTLTAAGTICGVLGGRDGKEHFVWNDTGQSVTVAHDSGVDPTPANRIYTPQSADVVVAHRGWFVVEYSGAYSRWILRDSYPVTATATNAVAFLDGNATNLNVYTSAGNKVDLKIYGLTGQGTNLIEALRTNGTVFFAVQSNGVVNVGGVNSVGELRLFGTNGLNYLAFKVQDGLAANKSITFDFGTPSAGQVFAWHDGNVVTNTSAPGTPVGADGMTQIKSGAGFAANSNLIYEASSGETRITNNIGDGKWTMTGRYFDIPWRAGVAANIYASNGLNQIYSLVTDTNLSVIGLTSNSIPLLVRFTQDSAGARGLTLTGVRDFFSTNQAQALAIDTNANSMTEVSLWIANGVTNGAARMGEDILLTKLALGTATSADLASRLTDEAGSGSALFGTASTDGQIFWRTNGAVTFSKPGLTNISFFNVDFLNWVGGQVVKVHSTGSVLTNGALDLADTDAVSGTLPDGNIPAAITRDTEWDSASEINTATTDDDFVTLAGVQTITGTKTHNGTNNFSAKVQMAGDVSPSVITASQNDYNPSGLANANILRLISSAAVNLTGIQSGTDDDGRLLALLNVGTTNITIKNSDAGSQTTNRFALNADVVLSTNDGCLLEYDTTDDRWRLIASSLVGGGAGGGDNISVNGTAATDADFDDATPEAAFGKVNVAWQKDSGTPNNISAQITAPVPEPWAHVWGVIGPSATAGENVSGNVSLSVQGTGLDDLEPDASNIRMKGRYTAATSSTDAGWERGGSNVEYLWSDRDFDFSAYYLLKNTNLVRAFVGVTASTLSAHGDDSTPAAEYAGFRYDADLEGTWKAVTDNGSGSPTVTDTGVALDGGLDRLAMKKTSGQVLFYIDGALEATHTTTLPSATTMAMIAGVTTLEAVSKTNYMGILYYKQPMP